jgi:amino acid transporter
MISLVGIRQLSPDKILSSNIPHWLLLESLFGKAGGILMAVLAITATSTSLNTVMAVVPRILYGMAHHKQIPAVFMKLHSKYKTPWIGILFFSFSIILVGAIFRGAQNFVIFLLISSATGWLITYIIAHINVMVLRKKYPDYKRPFKSPFYPWPQIIGIAGMVYALIKNAPTEEMTWRVYTIFGTFTGITTLYAFFWVKYKMKKGLLDPEPIENAISD